MATSLKAVNRIGYIHLARLKKILASGGSIGLKLSFKAKRHSAVKLNAALELNSGVLKEVCAVELNAKLIGEGGHSKLAVGENRTNVKLLAVVGLLNRTGKVEVVVVTKIGVGNNGAVEVLTDSLGGAEVEHSARNRLSAYGDKLVIHCGVGIGIDLENVIEDLASVSAVKIEVCMVGKVYEGILIAYSLVVNADSVLIEGIGNLNVKITGVVLLSVGAEVGENKLVLALYLCIPQLAVEAVLTTVEVVVLAGVDVELILLAVDKEVRILIRLP